VDGSYIVDPKNLIDSDYCDLSEDSMDDSLKPDDSSSDGLQSVSRRRSIDSFGSAVMARGIFNQESSGELDLIASLAHGNHQFSSPMITPQLSARANRRDSPPLLHHLQKVNIQTSTATRNQTKPS
jgi:hypothetical protein